MTADANVFHCIDMLYQYSCEWNYRPDHCMYMSNCRAAELHGISMLHGCRRAFHIDKWSVFKAVYQAIENVSSHLCKLAVVICRLIYTPMFRTTAIFR